MVATDESGQLAQSFNRMVQGLEERERLREAFGAYVDPGLAERVLREGSELAGEELDVSILFLDIRDFTAFTERYGDEQTVVVLASFRTRVREVAARRGVRVTKWLGDGAMLSSGDTTSVVSMSASLNSSGSFRWRGSSGSFATVARSGSCHARTSTSADGMLRW